MTEKGERLIQVSVEFQWQHPANGCPMFNTKKIVTESFNAAGSSISDARRYATLLAENTPQICDLCKEDYIFQGRSDNTVKVL